MKGVTAESCQVNKVGGEVERNMHGVSGKFKSSFKGGEMVVKMTSALSSDKEMIARPATLSCHCWVAAGSHLNYYT